MMDGLCFQLDEIWAPTCSLPEICGDAAIYFDPLDAAGMTESLRSVLTDAPLADQLRVRGAELQRLVPSPVVEAFAPGGGVKSELRYAFWPWALIVMGLIRAAAMRAVGLRLTSMMHGCYA